MELEDRASTAASDGPTKRAVMRRMSTLDGYDEDDDQDNRASFILNHPYRVDEDRVTVLDWGGVGAILYALLTGVGFYEVKRQFPGSGGLHAGILKLIVLSFVPGVIALLLPTTPAVEDDKEFTLISYSLVTLTSAFYFSYTSRTHSSKALEANWGLASRKAVARYLMPNDINLWYYDSEAQVTRLRGKILIRYSLIAHTMCLGQCLFLPLVRVAHDRPFFGSDDGFDIAAVMLMIISQWSAVGFLIYMGLEALAVTRLRMRLFVRFTRLTEESLVAAGGNGGEGTDEDREAMSARTSIVEQPEAAALFDFGTAAGVREWIKVRVRLYHFQAHRMAALTSILGVCLGIVVAFMVILILEAATGKLQKTQSDSPTLRIILDIVELFTYSILVLGFIARAHHVSAQHASLLQYHAADRAADAAECIANGDPPSEAKTAVDELVALIADMVSTTPPPQVLGFEIDKNFIVTVVATFGTTVGSTVFSFYSTGGD